MASMLYFVNPFDISALNKVGTFANKTNNKNLVNYYQNLSNLSEHEYFELKTQDNYYNEPVFLLVEGEIKAAAYIEGYKDEGKYSMTFQSLPESKELNKSLLSLATTYLIDELNAELVSITVKNQEDNLINFAINNNYEVLDRGTNQTELIREATKRK